MKLKLYNSLTREKEEFQPQDETRVTMYNCGPTVYSYAHIGNARAAVAADVLFRVLRHIYGEDQVVYARNLTDIDDKIIAAAKEQGVPMEELTEKYARIYNEDLAALGCLEPTYQPKATDNIKEMADIIVRLLDKDIAYISEDHVLFDVTKMEDYGKLSGRKLGDNLAGARVEVASYKRNAADFVLWKPSKKDEPSWNPSNRFPPGRPGWHLECSAMIKRTLGETIDIHCGGIDLKFPHHENEIAQSCCASGLLEKDGPRDENGNPIYLAKFWVHNGFLQMDSTKMSKSLGNVKLIHELLETWDGEVLRFALLSGKYREELDWTDDLLKQSKATLDGWYRILQFVNKWNSDEMPTSDIVNILLDDLNTPLALSGLGSIKDTIRHLVMAGAPTADNGMSMIYAQTKKLITSANLLGLLQKDPEEWFRGTGKEGGLTDAQIDDLIDERAAVRAAKNWARADEIRDIFKAENIVLEDGKDGTTWRRG